MNSVCLVGKLTRHPLVRFEGESQVTSFTLMITEPSREGKAFTLYVPCVAWGRAAETCSVLNAEDLVAIATVSANHVSHHFSSCWTRKSPAYVLRAALLT